MYLRKAIRGTIQVFFFIVLAAFSTYLLRILLVSKISISEYGLFYAILSFLTLFGLFVDFGTAQAVSRRIVALNITQEYNKIKNLLFFTSILQFVISAAIVLVLALFSRNLLSGLFHSDQTILFFLMLFWFLTVPLSSIFTIGFSGFQRPGLMASTEFFRQFFFLVLSFTFLSSGLGQYSPFLAYALVNIAVFLVYFPLLSKVLPGPSKFKIKFFPKEMKNIFVFGFHVAISWFLYTIMTQTDTLMITFFLGLKSAGIYQIAMPVASIIMYLPSVIIPVVYPMISELVAKKKSAELRQGLELLYKYGMSLCIPLVMIIFSYSDYIINMLFGPQYSDASPVVKILVFAMLFSVITTINGMIISALGSPQKIARYMMYGVLANVVLNFFLIQSWGIEGAALSTLISFLMTALISAYLLKSAVDLSYPLKELIAIFGAGFLLSFTVEVLKAILDLNLYLEIATILVLSTAVYCLVLVLLGIINIKELRSFIEHLLPSTR